MYSIKKLILIKLIIIAILLGIFVAGAIPRYINLNKHTEASECRRNQMIVETALAVAYAESLAVGSERFPSKLTKTMFDDAVIPRCPVDNKTIAFDSQTGTAFCPNHIKSHHRIY